MRQDTKAKDEKDCESSMWCEVIAVHALLRAIIVFPMDNNM